jgi:hypothetical protein
MDGITTGSRPESRGWAPSSVSLALRELFPYCTLPDRISADGWTRRPEDRYNKKKRVRKLEKRSLTLSFLSYGVSRTLYLGTTPPYPYSPPLSNPSNPCLQLSGPWFMDELRPTVRPLRSPFSRRE